MLVVADFWTAFLVVGAHGSIKDKALRYKPEGRGFETRRDECIFSNLQNPSGHTRPWGLLSPNRNEYQKHRNHVSGSRARPVCRADNLTVICEPIV
jgi:hypothetical protein